MHANAMLEFDMIVFFSSVFPKSGLFILNSAFSQHFLSYGMQDVPVLLNIGVACPASLLPPFPSRVCLELFHLISWTLEES